MNSIVKLTLQSNFEALSTSINNMTELATIIKKECSTYGSHIHSDNHISNIVIGLITGDTYYLKDFRKVPDNVSWNLYFRTD